MFRTLALVMLASLLPVPAGAQMAVIDPANLAADRADRSANAAAS